MHQLTVQKTIQVKFKIKKDDLSPSCVIMVKGWLGASFLGRVETPGLLCCAERGHFNMLRLPKERCNGFKNLGIWTDYSPECKWAEFGASTRRCGLHLLAACLTSKKQSQKHISITKISQIYSVLNFKTSEPHINRLFELICGRCRHSSAQTSLLFLWHSDSGWDEWDETLKELIWSLYFGLFSTFWCRKSPSMRKF